MVQTGFYFFIHMKFILGKKIAMTQLWQGDSIVPVTRIEAGPCTVLQLKTTDRDGYRAVQVGYGVRRADKIRKPQRGHYKDFGNFPIVREFRVADEINDLPTGSLITVKTFTAGDKLTVTGTSKGKGFQGVVKRHGFHGQDATHGNKDQLRASGSVGAGGIQHVLKGTRMGGRMGGDRCTLHDVEVVSVDEATNSVFVKGAVPGARNSLVLLSGEGELLTGAIEPVVEIAAEETVTDEVVTAETTEAPIEETSTDEPATETADVKEEATENTEAAVEAEAKPIVEAAVEPVVAAEEAVTDTEAPVTDSTEEKSK